MGTLIFEQNNAKSVLSIPLRENTTPSQVRIDPNGKILCTIDFNHGETTLGNVAREGKDVVARIRAYYELIKIGTPTAMTIVHSTILSETFYGVRAKGNHYFYRLL